MDNLKRFDDMEDNIRPPDLTRQEQLIEDTRSEFEKQIDQAMYLSMRDLSENQQSNEKYEQQLLDDYLSETNNRKDIFRDFLLNLNKISRFDKEVREIYEIIDPIIECYCNQYIQICELDEETYDKIFSILKKIRNSQNVFDILKTIITKEE